MEPKLFVVAVVVVVPLDALGILLVLFVVVVVGGVVSDVGTAVDGLASVSQTAVVVQRHVDSTFRIQCIMCLKLATRTTLTALPLSSQRALDYMDFIIIYELILLCH